MAASADGCSYAPRRCGRQRYPDAHTAEDRSEYYTTRAWQRTKRMDSNQATKLIGGGVAEGGVWADLGAGEGTFTRALAHLLGPGGTVWAVDRDRSAVRALSDISVPRAAEVHAVLGDFTAALDLPVLDGALLANALHFVEDQEAALRGVLAHVRPAGALLLVEYDRRRSDPWVPHPVPPARFQALCVRVGLLPPTEIGRRPSTYQGDIYASVSYKPDP